MSWLDVKLGFRMLVKYPGLTVVGGLAMAFAIAVGAGGYEALAQRVDPRIPLDDGGRIVGIRSWQAETGRWDARVAREFLVWREELATVEDLGAFRTIERNLIAGDRPGEPVPVAEISASAFRLARVPPLLGRTLDAADEEPGAAPVVVLGHDVWRARFGGDPGVVGRTVRLGSAEATVVGVMPAGFAFPVAHDLWVPLRLSVPEYESGGGPAIRVFGRLAPGVSLDEAQAELAVIGSRAADDDPGPDAGLRSRVMPYAQSITGVSGLESLGLRSINLFFVMLLVLVCGNVALLMFARAAAREGELVVRTALGASRGRIIGQLFAEALVLAGIAAAFGLAGAGFALRGWLGVAEAEAGGRVPFWFDGGLSPETVLYAAGLAVLGAAVAGVVPALKVTGRGVRARLDRANAGGGGLRFGGVWTAVIVAQVAVTVAFPAAAFFVRRGVVQIRTLDVGFPAEEYVSARLEADPEVPPGVAVEAGAAELRARFGATLRELDRRLAAEPGVVGVTFTTELPRTYHAQSRVEVDGGAEPRESGPAYRVGTASVAVDYFDVLGTEVLSGRGFRPADLASSGPGAVVVNRSFVRRVLGGRNPIGRRVRYTAAPDQEPGPWYEIVGVVRDLGMVNGDVAEDAGLYHPLAVGAAVPVHVAVHVRGRPGAFVPRLRAVAGEVDPRLRLYDALPLDEVGSSLWREFAFLFRLLVVVSAVALLLSLAGIYAVMAFTVARRTREIGVRVALGADAWRVVPAIFRRPLAQVGLGVAAGGCLVGALAAGVLRGELGSAGAALVVAYAGLMMAVCMLACVVPTRRALRVEPTEALRAEG